MVKQCGKVATAWREAFAECGGGGARTKPGDGQDDDKDDCQYEHVIAGGVKHRVRCGKSMTEDDWAALEARPQTGKRGKRVAFKVVEHCDVSFCFDVPRYICMLCRS